MSKELGHWKQVVFLGVLAGVAALMGISYWQKERLRAKTVAVYQSQITAAAQQINSIAEAAFEKQINRRQAGKQLDEQTVVLEDLRLIIASDSAALLPEKQAELDQRIAEILADLPVTKAKVSGIEKIADLAPIYDLRIAVAGFQNQMSALINHQAWFVDHVTAQALGLDLNSKKFVSIPLGQSPTDRLWATNNARHYYQIETTGAMNNKLTISTYTLNIQASAPEITTIPWPKELTDELVAILAGENNLYFFLNDPPQIYRQKIDPQTVIENGARSWWQYNPDITKQQPDLNQLSDVTIDNSLWLAQKDGQVFKLTSGQVTNWQLRNLSEPLSGELRLDTDYDNDDGMLVILNPATGRIVIANKKNGEVEREIRSELFVGAQDIILDEPAGKMFITGENLVYEVKMDEQSA